MQRATRHYIDSRGQLTSHTLQAIPEGVAGTRATLKHMRELVREWRVHPLIRQHAKQITQRCAPKNYCCELTRVHAFVRDRVKYLRDVRGVETIQTPQVTLRDRSGDCDDQSVLLASLLESIGHPTRFVAIGFMPGRFHHVYTESAHGADWVPAETTERWKLGVGPSSRVVRSRMVQHV